LPPCRGHGSSGPFAMRLTGFRSSAGVMRRQRLAGGTWCERWNLSRWLVMDDRACEWCGASLEGKNADARFCGRRCAESARRKEDPEKFRAKDRERYKKHKEARKAASRSYRWENCERINASRRESYRSDPEPQKAIARLRHRTSAAKLHMQEAMQAIPAIMAMIEDATKETTK